MGSPSDEHRDISNKMQDVAKEGYVLQGRFGYRSGKNAFAMASATMPGVETEHSNAIVFKRSFLVVQRTLCRIIG